MPAAHSKYICRGLSVLIVVMAFLLQPSTSGAQENLSPDRPFSIRFITSPEKGSLLKSVQLSIVAPGGATRWQSFGQDRSAIKSLTLNEPVKASGWYIAPGKYSLAAEVQLKGDANRRVKASQEFEVNGQELRFHSVIAFSEAEKLQARILRVLPGSDRVSLERDWTPTPDGQLRYRIVNGLNQPIYGIGIRGNFFGDIQTELSGGWEKFRRGSFCEIVGAGKPLAHGQQGESIEGYFIGEQKRFATGKYRYVLNYTLTPSIFGIIQFEKTEKGSVPKHVAELYELYDEFSIFSAGEGINK